jgi:hypothetical protein
MPVIIDEVVISVEVTTQAPGGATGALSGADERQGIINECVERVLEILREKGER